MQKKKAELYKNRRDFCEQDLPANGTYFLFYEAFQDEIKRRLNRDTKSIGWAIVGGGLAGIAYWCVGMPADVIKSRIQTDLPANGTYFLFYEAFQDEIKRRLNRDTKSIGWSIVGGGLSGIVYWCVGMPADVIKSRIQTAPEGTTKRIHTTFFETIRQDGPLALYRGVVPVMLRTFPANAATFSGIELVNGFFRKVLPDW